ncbi:MAG TPA: hypothetical protein VHT96_05185 [Clostridia bacterium]|nr:hypothetical protein [Clostridia bacterium]
MQSKGSVLIFLIILAFPVIAIFSDHQIFFVIMSIIIAFVSCRYIFNLLSGNGLGDSESDEELEEELEDMVDIDIRLFGTGMSVAYNLLVILFLVYCTFFLGTVLLNGITALAIILQIHFIVKKLGSKSQSFDINRYKPQILISSLLNLTVIILAAINKIAWFY